MEESFFNEADVVEQNPEYFWFLISDKFTGREVNILHRETDSQLLCIALNCHHMYVVTPVQDEDFAAVYDKIYTVEVINEIKRRYYEVQRSLHN